MATYVPIHGAGDMGWYLHLVERELRSRGHRVVVMDLPVDDHAATLSDYADVVVQAIATLVAATTPSMINTDTERLQQLASSLA
jgi:prephenate dehydrogenase